LAVASASKAKVDRCVPNSVFESCNNYRSRA
jgi:hypothetical protein